MYEWTSHILENKHRCLLDTDLRLGEKTQGKVRDFYHMGEQSMIITTDRQSAFDRVLTAIPFKGQVLNLVSAWWFDKTKHIMPNHVLSVPHPNVTIAKTCEVFPVELVVRAYITGSTNTSIWTQYQAGVRDYCGITLPDGLKKNQPLPNVVVTPTTKDKDGDRLLSPQSIIDEGLMTESQWAHACEKALALFHYGAEIADERGLMLVDTKYEMGLDNQGELVLLDEIHTPDSSRFWKKATYASRMAEGQEPESLDKEFLRLWYQAHCNPYQDEQLPEPPAELIVRMSSLYIEFYEQLLQTPFQFPDKDEPLHQSILDLRDGYFLEIELNEK